MKRPITDRDVQLLNLILERDQRLGDLVLGRLEALEAALNSTAAAPATPQAQGSDSNQSKTAEIKPRILDWFRAHAGKHPLSAVRTDLGVALSSKPFKTAVAELVSEKAIKSSGKRGKGSEYWI